MSWIPFSLVLPRSDSFNYTKQQITIFGIGALIVCLLPQCKRKPWRHVRTAILISMGLSGVLPMTHAAQRFGVRQACLQMGWDWYVGEGIFYVLGAIIYAVSILSLCFFLPNSNLFT